MRDVLGDAGLGSDHHEAADTAELVDANAAADIGPVVHLHVAAEHHVVDQHHVVPHPAVMGDVGSDHDQVIVADRRHRFVGIAAVERGIFANPVVVANDQLAAGVLPLQMLGGSSQDCSLADFVAAAQHGAALDHRAGLQPAAVANDGPRFDYGERSNADLAPQLRGRIDQGRWVNVGHSWVSRGKTILGPPGSWKRAKSFDRLARAGSA